MWLDQRYGPEKRHGTARHGTVEVALAIEQQQQQQQKLESSCKVTTRFT
jgi:hypothetical protein